MCVCARESERERERERESWGAAAMRGRNGTAAGGATRCCVVWASLIERVEARRAPALGGVCCALPVAVAAPPRVWGVL